MNIKKIFCKHKELSDRKIEYRNAFYNEFFGKVMITEFPYRECLKCGEKVEELVCRPTFLEDIEKEKYEEFKKKRM